MLRFTVEFNLLNQQIPVRFNQSDQRIPITFKNLQQITGKPDVEIYDGSYQVTPKVTSQTMETAQKFLTDDVTIKAIPFFNVANTSGGNTVFIGKELE
jgi:hypothetical protein